MIQWLLRKIVGSKNQRVLKRLWPIVRKVGTHETLTPYEVSFVSSITEVLDASTSRLAKGFDRLPTAIMVMLLFVACASMAVAGYSSGRQGHMQRWRMTALALSIAAVMTTVIDFDRPSVGFVKINQSGFVDLANQMEKELEPQ